ncbi:MAG: hypothetical protein ACXWZG_00050 [Microbacterium sp.]
MQKDDRWPLELTEVSNGAWRVSDLRVPLDSALHIVASIEAHAQDFEVLWIRGAVVAPGHFRSLSSALEAVDEVVIVRA